MKFQLDLHLITWQTSQYQEIVEKKVRIRSKYCYGLIHVFLFAAADCGENARKCDDGAHCVYDFNMCNGFQNCPDGSDEALQNCTKGK